MWPSPWRTGGANSELNSTLRGALGDCRQDRQGWAHPHGAASGLGQSGARHVDGDQWDQRRPGVPVHWDDGMTPKVLWEIVNDAAARVGIERLAPRDLRSTRARLCHLAGGELDQNSCSGTCRSKPLSASSDASRSFGLPSTTCSESSRSLGRKAVDGRVPTFRP